MARRRGLFLGVCVAVLTLLTGVYRYALVWCALLGFLLVVDAAVRSIEHALTSRLPRTSGK